MHYYVFTVIRAVASDGEVLQQWEEKRSSLVKSIMEIFTVFVMLVISTIAVLFFHMRYMPEELKRKCVCSSSRVLCEERVLQRSRSFFLILTVRLFCKL